MSFLQVELAERKVEPANEYLVPPRKKPEQSTWTNNKTQKPVTMQWKQMIQLFLQSGIERVHRVHVQKREKGTKNEREFVFYKSLIFSLDSIPDPIVHTIYPLWQLRH
jgi:hypothetical protein